MATTVSKPDKFVITAINRLTGEREAISSPRNLLQAEAMLQKMRTTPQKTKFRARAYKYPRIDKYVLKEGDVVFKSHTA